MHTKLSTWSQIKQENEKGKQEHIPGAAHRSRTWSPAEIFKAETAAPEAASIPYI